MHDCVTLDVICSSSFRTSMFNICFPCLLFCLRRFPLQKIFPGSQRNCSSFSVLNLLLCISAFGWQLSVNPLSFLQIIFQHPLFFLSFFTFFPSAMVSRLCRTRSNAVSTCIWMTFSLVTRFFESTWYQFILAFCRPYMGKCWSLLMSSRKKKSRCDGR